MIDPKNVNIGASEIDAFAADSQIYGIGGALARFLSRRMPDITETMRIKILSAQYTAYRDNALNPEYRGVTDAGIEKMVTSRVAKHGQKEMDEAAWDVIRDWLAANAAQKGDAS